MRLGEVKSSGGGREVIRTRGPLLAKQALSLDLGPTEFIVGRCDGCESQPVFHFPLFST